MKFKVLFFIGTMICVLTGCRNNTLGSVQSTKNTSDNQSGGYFQAIKCFGGNVV